MKACRTCGRMYPDDAGYCPVDGTQLLRASVAPITPAEQDTRVGQVLCGKYQVRRVIADGGMGRVYEALDLAERRNVALKVLHQDAAFDAIALARFRREFEASSLLPHAHIVEVFAFEPTGDGSFALVMEFLYGEELRNTLRREQVIHPARLVRMLSQIALALDEAHERGLVHRDLKPENIFLCQAREGDTVKLLDFGSVKDTTETKKLTVHGTTIGSPHYMSPEQAQGLDSLDQRADVWSMAAIVYECVVGKVPFSGATGPAILLEILTKQPEPPSRAAAAQKYPVPATLDRVLLHAFKKNASLRLGSVGALASAVGAAYGLNGSYPDWAAINEAGLALEIEAKLPELLRMAQVNVPKTSVADSFFGEGEALRAFDEPAGTSSRPALPASDAVPLKVPTEPLPWRLLLIVGGGALILGILLAVVAYLR